MTKGASFFAANFSSSFRTRPILLSDGLNVPVNLEIVSLDENNEPDLEALHKEVELYPIKSKFGSKK